MTSGDVGVTSNIVTLALNVVNVIQIASSGSGDKEPAGVQ
jgi:hypothetical protein